MGKKVQRQKALVQIIQAQGLLPVKVLSSMLGVSDMTVRRDLEVLHGECQHEVPCGEGIGAQNGDYNLLQALEKANEQKDRIGRFAASLIEPDDVIIIDTGSTTARMLSHIPADYNLTVVCYNANVLAELRYRADVNLLFCGGVYHPNTEMFESQEGIQFVRRIRANKVFLSAAGVHKELGITCANTYEVPTKSAVIKSSSQRILMVDSGKFDQLRSAYFCELDDVSAVVTDDKLSEEWQKLIRDRGIALYLV